MGWLPPSYLLYHFSRTTKPRSRGENSCFGDFGCGTAGSSPLTRGKPCGEGASCFPEGLIPAHAGKTDAWVGEFFEWRAHPRSRGENPTAYRGNAANAGSSPLTRGKPPRPRRGHRRRGLIPAHAGKTVLAIQLRICAWAHPRSRGENPPGGDDGQSIGGSSPLTRGKRARNERS